MVQLIDAAKRTADTQGATETRKGDSLAHLLTGAIAPV